MNGPLRDAPPAQILQYPWFVGEGRAAILIRSFEGSDNRKSAVGTTFSAQAENRNRQKRALVRGQEVAVQKLHLPSQTLLLLAPAWLLARMVEGGS